MWTRLSGLLFLFTSCSTAQHMNYRTMDNELTELRQTVERLQGTLDMLTNFVAGDFSSCNEAALPPFETQICRMAQTATADQILIINGQLTGMISKLQTSLFGNDCTSITDPGCPLPGSVMHTLTAVQADITALETSVDDIEADILALQSDIAWLDARLDQLETTLAGAEYFRWVFLCAGTTANNEPVLLRGDRMELRGYVATVSNNGMGLVATANLSGHQFLQTNVSPKCNFRVYDQVTELKICWKHGDRTASAAAIDTECNLAGNFTPAGANCVCK